MQAMVASCDGRLQFSGGGLLGARRDVGILYIML